MSAPHDPPSPASVIAREDVHHSGKPKETVWRKIVNWMTAIDDEKDKWLENMRGMLSLVSTVIATITFQASINPPGGVLPAKENSTSDDLKACLKESRPCAGEAILPIVYADEYYNFQVCNTIAFVASPSVTPLLVSGLPLKNRFPTWTLLIGMVFTLTFVALAYRHAMVLVTPSFGGPWMGTQKIVKRTIRTWFVLAGILTFCLTVRFLVWLLKLNKCIMRFKQGTQQLQGINRTISDYPVCELQKNEIWLNLLTM